jgi:hypothetical protein
MGGELRSFEAEGTGDDGPRPGGEAARRRCANGRTLSREADVEFVTGQRGRARLDGRGRQPARVLARAQVSSVAPGLSRNACARSVEHIASAIDPELAVTVAEQEARHRGCERRATRRG